ncbi:MAG: zinc dependent phospholipase C family protein [Nitrospirae bacterium]|nr:zinc dependent phospholipase C family protein [Nitrospirota bacterium]
MLDLGIAAVPSGIYAILKKNAKDYLYGNLSADIIVGRKYQESGKNTHSWEIGLRLLDAAKTARQKAFAYGYLSHLSADTVVHNLSESWLPFSHSIIEIKAESLVDRRYRRELRSLDDEIQQRHDPVLEEMLERVFFSFKTNKKIFRGMLFISRFPNYKHVSRFINNRFPNEVPVSDIYKYKEESLKKIIEILTHGSASDVVKEHPLGRHLKRVS